MASWMWGAVIFLILGLCTRFAFLDHPNEVVFDEFHFFHFVSEYEEGEYFFDIHPPLGKLILWANAKMHGLPEFIDAVEDNRVQQEQLEMNYMKVRDEYLALEKEGNTDAQTLLNLKIKYQSLKEESENINTGGLETYTIGAEYHEELSTWGVRSVPAFFGALLVPLMFVFAFFLTSSLPIAAIIGVITLFSPAFLVESQYVFMDSMLMFFVVACALCALLYAKMPSWKWWIAGTVCAAMAVSIKWTGATGVGAMGMAWLFVIMTQKDYIQSLLKGLMFWVVVPAVYIATFWVHFTILSHSGEGDAFHTPEFRMHLENSTDYGRDDIEAKGFFIHSAGTDWVLQSKENPYYDPIKEDSKPFVPDWNNWKWYGRFVELNVQMGERSASIRNEHPFASRPEDWVVGEKSIYLWNKDGAPAPESGVAKVWDSVAAQVLPENDVCRDVYQQQLHLFPNSFVWTLLTFSTLFLGIVLCMLLARNVWYWFQKKELEYDGIWNGVFIVVMTLANILPFVLIHRPQFLYHAFEGVLFALLGLSLSLYFIFKALPWKNVLWIVFGAITTALVLFFVIELPLIYGFSFHDCYGKSLFGLF